MDIWAYVELYPSRHTDDSENTLTHLWDGTLGHSLTPTTTWEWTGGSRLSFTRVNKSQFSTDMTLMGVIVGWAGG